MPTTIRELDGLRATIDRVVFMPHLDAPEDRPYPFVYFITIHNDSPEPVQIKGRKWVVTDADDQRVVVEGGQTCASDLGEEPRAGRPAARPRRPAT